MEERHWKRLRRIPMTGIFDRHTAWIFPLNIYLWRSFLVAKRKAFYQTERGWREDSDWPQLVVVLVGHRPCLSEKASLESDKNAGGKTGPAQWSIRQTGLNYRGRAGFKELGIEGSWYSTRPPTALITDVCVSQLTAHLWSTGHSGPAQSWRGERTFYREAERERGTQRRTNRGAH